MTENVFPISFKEFRKETNVKKVAIGLCPEGIKKNEQDFKTYLRTCEHSIYFTYFQDPDGRVKSAQKYIKIKDSVSDVKRSIYLQLKIRYPVSFEEFKTYTNVLEVAESHVNQLAKCENKAMQIEQIGLNIYRNYYTFFNVRNVVPIQFKPCDSVMQNRLLQFAFFYAPTEDHTPPTVQKDTPEPAHKRKRTLLDEVDSTTENTPEVQCLPSSSQQSQLQPIDNHEGNPENPQVPGNKLQNFVLLKSAAIPEEFLGKYIDAYLERKKVDWLKQHKAILEKNCEQRRRLLTQGQEVLRLKRKGPMRITSFTKKNPSTLDSVHIFFKTYDKFHRLSETQYNNNNNNNKDNTNELYSRIIHSICHMSIEEFRYYTCIYGAPVDFYKKMDILKRCYEFTLKNPKVWPLNLYISLKDLFSFLKAKNIPYVNASLKDISPKILIWNDLVSLTNFDECAFAESPGCRKHLNKKRFTYYNSCWAHDSWIGTCPNITDPIMIKTIELSDSITRLNIKGEPGVPRLINGMDFWLAADEINFDIMEVEQSVISIGEDKNTVAPTDEQIIENEETIARPLLKGYVCKQCSEALESIQLYHQCENCVKARNENRETILLRRKLFFCAFNEFLFFENLSLDQIAQYNLNSNGLRQRFVRSTVNCNELVFIYSLSFFQIYLSMLSSLSGTLVTDLEIVLRDIRDYRYHKYNYIKAKRISEYPKDIRNRVLSFFFLLLPRFCACDLSRPNGLSDAGVCSFAQHNLSESVCSKLPKYVKPSIIKKIESLKASEVF